MKKLLGLIAIPFLAGVLHARALSLDPNQTGQLTIGTNTSAPTQVFTNDTAATRTCVVNTSTNTIYFVGYSTSSATPLTTPGTISTSTSFSLPGTSANLQAIPFCFDGNQDAFMGPLWAVAATGGNVIQRIRMH